MSEHSAVVEVESKSERPRCEVRDRITSRGRWGKVRLSRDYYYVALLFNLAAFILPPLYDLLSKLWLARIDSSEVITLSVVPRPML